MSSRVFKKAVSGASVAVLAGGIALSAAMPSSAAIDGMTNNYSSWWVAHAQVWIFNSSSRLQSVAHLGNVWYYGPPSWSESRAHVDGYSWTHEAYQIRWA
ncbi:hypothetical protein ACIPWF_08170 [Paenarthrobacter sp. NPDC089989]|uniref:hypothetical protein n=1 Tax=unclassified Paenarthrobacter TaxID=2634190 RepID=UPI0037F440BD